MQILNITHGQQRYEYVCKQLELSRKQQEKDELKMFKKKLKMCKKYGVPMTISIDKTE